MIGKRPKRRHGTAWVRGTGLLLLLLAGLAVGAEGDAPLTTTDVVRFLNAGISERTILSELQSRGFDDALTEAREARLREAGATETLVVAIRRVAPPAPEPAVAAAAAPGGPSGSTSSLPRTATFAADTRTVRVPVSVLDRAGQPVLGLGAANFRVADDGKLQPVTLFSGERRALRIALALDVSGSMRNKIRQVEAALRHFIELLEPNDEILVATFDGRVRVLQDFTADREQLARVLDMLEPYGPTALFDAVAASIRRVAPGAAESKAVVLVTDGVDTESRTSFDALRELARRSEVPIFSLGLDAGDLRDIRRPSGAGGGPRPPGVGGRGGGGRGGWPGGGMAGPSRGGNKPDGFDAKPLQELADDTGGRCVIVKGLEHYTPGEDAPGSGALKAAVESIAMTLRHRYLVGYEPPEGKQGWRTIRVEVDQPSLTARARKGYYSRS